MRYLRLSLALAVSLIAAPLYAQQLQGAPVWPGVTLPTFVITASAVTGGGTVTSPQLLAQDGICAAPAYSFTSAPTKGIHGAVAGGVTVCVSSATIGVFAGGGLNLGTLALGFAGGDPAVTSIDASFARDAAAAIQMGADAAGVTDQMFKGPDRITSDGVGGNLTIAGGRNRGASVGGSIIFQTSPAAGAGVTGTLATALTIDSTKLATFVGNVVTPVANATTGFQINSAATSGNYLIGNGTNFVSLAPAMTTALPADQTGNATATFKMNGLGAAGAPCTITPVATGRVLFMISGTVFNATAIADGATYKIAYGTGAAPANAAAATGTVISAAGKYVAATTAEKAPFAIQASVTGLALSTAHWFDLQVADITAGTASFTDVTCTALER